MSRGGEVAAAVRPLLLVTGPMPGYESGCIGGGYLNALQAAGRLGPSVMPGASSLAARCLERRPLCA